MSWKDVLPIDKIRNAILFVFLAVGFVAIGSVATFIYTRNDFERGMNYMARAYTTGGMVDRVKITGHSTRKELEER